MKLVDRPATVEWYEMPMRPVQRGLKNDPVQRQKSFDTVAAAAEFWKTLPPDVAEIQTLDGITLRRGDIEAILRGLE